MPREELRRSLRVPDGTAMAAGAVLGPSVLVLPALTARTAGPASLVAWGAMSLFALALAVTLGRAGARIPHAGGIVAYSRAAFGPRLTTVTGWWLLASVPFAVPVIALVGAQYITAYYGLDARWAVAVAGLLLGTSCLLNARGLKLSGWVQVRLVVLTGAVLVGVSLLGLPKVRTEHFTPFLPHGWGAVGTAALLIFWSYIGFEMVVHLAEEFRRPDRDLPLSMALASVVLSVVYCLSAVVTVGSGVYAAAAGLAPVSALAADALGPAAGAATAFFALCCSFVAVHTNIAGFSRLMYAQAREGLLPRSLGRLHPRHATPARALGVLATVFALLLVGVAVFRPGLEELIAWPSATFVAVYLVGATAAYRILPRTDPGRLAAAVTVLVCLAILPFSLPAVLYPVGIALLGAALTRRSARARNASPKASRNALRTAKELAMTGPADQPIDSATPAEPADGTGHGDRAGTTAPDGPAATVGFDGESLRIADVRRVAEERVPCEVTEKALARAARSREIFEATVRDDVPVYGVTTGYGEMIYMLVDTAKEVELQTNLVRSHSAGVGPLFDERESRAILAARLNALSKGYSAVRPELLERLALYLTEGITPAIPQIGSLGASGDLAPLAHLAATVIGEGYVLKDGKRVETGPVLRSLGIEPLQLRFKEGLALINGTSAMTGLGCLVASGGMEQVRQAEIITALVVEVLQASASPFQPEGHNLARPHRGQMDTAANMRVLTHGSRLLRDHSDLRREAQESKHGGEGVHRTDVYIQKAYSLRAIPQILGAVRDTLYHAQEKLEIELNSANDNPLFFEGEEIFHGANFHGQPIAFAMDFTTIALTQLGVLSERRTNRLLNRHLSDGLPEFLVAGDPGLNSGFAGAQYPATALVAENRTIGPASTQSVPSNGDNQDVVSMGLISARNARRVLANNQRILAVELLAAAQAVDIARRYDGLSPVAQGTYEAVRSLVPSLDHDRWMSDDIETIAGALSEGAILRAATDRAQLPLL
ncbi:tyrosine 2,3-aminomutase [Streptomyces sp. MST-110588]|nr:tyrosine 2,3-aminomutase [Streptomyces sp. MST-110588]